MKDLFCHPCSTKYSYWCIIGGNHSLGREVFQSADWSFLTPSLTPALVWLLTTSPLLLPRYRFFWSRSHEGGEKGYNKSFFFFTLHVSTVESVGRERIILFADDSLLLTQKMYPYSSDTGCTLNSAFLFQGKEDIEDKQEPENTGFPHLIVIPPLPPTQYDDFASGCTERDRTNKTCICAAKTTLHCLLSILPHPPTETTETDRPNW